MEPLSTPNDSSNHDPANITEERAARRFHQMRHLETTLSKIEKRILDAKDKLGVLKEQHAAIIETIRESARDEGALPLFEDLD